MTKLYVYVALLALAGSLVGASYIKGRSDGRETERQEQRELISQLNDQLRRSQLALADAERLRLEQIEELKEQVNELGRQANEDPNAGRAAVGVGSVRRLNQIR